MWYCGTVMFYIVRLLCLSCVFFFFKQKTAYEMRISDWSSDVCSSDLRQGGRVLQRRAEFGVVLQPLLDEVLDRLDVMVGGALDFLDPGRVGDGKTEIGRASCRERVCQYV